MGDPRRLRKKFDSPRQPWDKTRVVGENELAEKYGLSAKREIWSAKTTLDKKRQSARKLLAGRSEEIAVDKQKLIGSLAKLGILEVDANLDDVLALKVDDFLERRLQTIIFRAGLANTIKQGRQFITHGFIEVVGKKVKSPGYMVTKDEEKSVKYYKNKKPKILDVSMESPEMQKKEDTLAKEKVKEEPKEEKTEEKKE